MIASSIAFPERLPADEQTLLADAAGFAGPEWSDLTEYALRELTLTRGIDFATAYCFDRLRRSSRHGPFVAKLEALPDTAGPCKGAGDILVAVAPGGFYRERPETGADGRFVLEQAVRLGCRTAVIPLHSFGRLRANAQIICAWLEQQHGPVILVSLSKSGAEVRLALEATAACFAPVIAWVNLSGVVRGTPIANWLLRRPMRSLLLRLMFWTRGYSFAAVREMQRGPSGRLDMRFEVPEHLKLVHLFGFPLTRHLSTPLARRGHRRLAPLGPNDGGANLLADLIGLPGQIVPVWGADHYLRPAWSLDRLIRRLFLHLVLDVSKSACAMRCMEEQKRDGD